MVLLLQEKANNYVLDLDYTFLGSFYVELTIPEVEEGCIVSPTAKILTN